MPDRGHAADDPGQLLDEMEATLATQLAHVSNGDIAAVAALNRRLAQLLEQSKSVQFGEAHSAQRERIKTSYDTLTLALASAKASVLEDLRHIARSSRCLAPYRSNQQKH